MADQDPVMRVVNRVLRKHSVRPRRRRRAKTQRIVDVALEVLSEYRPMTVRQIYYQLVARHILEQTGEGIFLEPALDIMLLGLPHVAPIGIHSGSGKLGQVVPH